MPNQLSLADELEMWAQIIERGLARDNVPAEPLRAAASLLRGSTDVDDRPEQDLPNVNAGPPSARRRRKLLPSLQTALERVAQMTTKPKPDT